MAETSVKEEMRKIAERLPDDATWEDVAHLIAMHERLARARRDSAAGLGVSLEEVEKEFGITSGGSLSFRKRGQISARFVSDGPNSQNTPQRN